jgi:acyl-CoA thioester hydrolase
MGERWPALAGRLEGTRHLLPVRVYFEDTDFSGLVYHANYLKFCERGRTDMLRLAGIRHHDLHSAEPPLAFVVRHMGCEFLKPARIDEVLEVETRIRAVTGARLELLQAIARGADALFRAQVTVALVGPDGRPRRLPESMRSALSALLDPAGA